nr:chromate transporter [bacterium]
MPSGKSKLKILWQIFLTFMKIGGFTFGGGYAMLPLIEHICIEKNKWMTEEEMADIIVIAESSPG